MFLLPDFAALIFKVGAAERLRSFDPDPEKQIQKDRSLRQLLHRMFFIVGKLLAA
ncbi:hypothetical protein HT737_11230 [Pseudomonas sp. MD195_PC81_125]|nr:hypothetical protein [Pseudomonas sp. MD195_PC81_125]